MKTAPRFFCDLETFSPVPIKYGTHRYAEEAEVMLWAYAREGGDVQVWDRTYDDRMPAELEDHLFDERVMTVWHNGAMFDRTVLKHAMGIELPFSRIHDTMVQALCHGLPGSLDKLCDIFGIPATHAKGKDGKAFINLFCKPRPKKMKLRRATRETHPEEWAGFVNYARLDIESMRILCDKIPMWNYKGTERELWELDQHINNRGIMVDTELANAAIHAVKTAKVELAERTEELTFGDLVSTTKRNEMLTYITNAYGIELPDLRMSTMETLLKNDEIPWMLRELITIRLMASSTSTSKYQALINGVSSDGALRGILQFCGASRTGRWAGRLFQPQNLPRMVVDAVLAFHNISAKEMTSQHVQEYIDAGIKAVVLGYADNMTDDVMTLCLNLVRSTLIPRPGKKMVVADLSNIEGRVAAWLAGEEWKLDAFRAYDAGTGEDLYKIAYAKSFRVDVKSVDKEMRQTGKVQELSLQYEGGVGAFVTFGLGYNIDLNAMAAKAYPHIPQRIVNEARQAWGWAVRKRSTGGLAEQTWVTCDSLKRLWREAHPAISSYWKEIEATAIEAIENPGVTFVCRKLKFRRVGAWLRMILPSGRSLCYARPSVVDGKIQYYGINQYDRSWGPIKTYGGKIFENCLGANTEVLTPYGWIAIRDITPAHEVWDGESWVNHGGLVYQGVKITLDFGGVRVTPTHKIWVEGKWIHAEEANHKEATSSYAEYYGTAQRYADRRKICRVGWKKIMVGISMRLRQKIQDAFIGIQKRQTKILRMRESFSNIKGEYNTQYVSPSRVRSMALNDGAMPEPSSRSVAQLWRQGDNCLPAMVRKFSKLLDGYGSFIRKGANARTYQQHGRVSTWKLPMGHAEGTSPQHTVECDSANSKRLYAPVGSSINIGNKSHNATVSTGGRLAGKPDVRQTRRKEQVFDILNCGPNNRFVIRGGDGLPFLVHNCCQAVARDVMAGNMPLIDDLGYEILLTCHDELITEAPDTDDFNSKMLAMLMAVAPSWARGLPLAADGFTGYRYRK